MHDPTRKPRVALLGAREDELDFLAELHRSSRVELVGVYDPDPNAAGLALAEIAGVPAGSDLAARDRLGEAEFVVLPANRAAFHRAIEWCSGLRAELVGHEEARRRWGSSTTRPAPARRSLDTRLRDLDAASARLASIEKLGEWLLEAAMHAVGATGGSLQLVSPDASELYLLAARGLAEEVVRTGRHPLGTPISGAVAALQKPQLLHGDQPGRGPGQRGRVTSAISVPLAAAGAVVGVLNVSSTVPGHRFGEPELEHLQRLGPTIASLLERARVFQAGAYRNQDAELVQLLQALDAERSDLPTTLTSLCQHLCARIEADSVAIYLSTEEGEWLRLGAAPRDPAAPGAPCSRAAANTAFVQGRWLHIVDAGEKQSPAAPAAENMADAVERALEPLSEPVETRSCVYAPLVGTTPVGVLAASFTRPAAAAAFRRYGEPGVRQVALYVETRVREMCLRARLERTSRLSAALPALLEAGTQGRLETVLVREAALLVAAERASLRHVDEDRRTYSRPTMHGAPVANPEAWRAVDARVTESTLQRREVQLTGTLRDEGDQLDHKPAYRSLVSVPILHGDRMLAVLNVYDKMPQHVLDGPAFTEFDRELLEGLGRVAAGLIVTGAASAAPAPPPAPAPAPAPDGVGSPDAGNMLADGAVLRDELRRELARAQRHNGEVGVSVLQFKGLRELSEANRQRLAGEILSAVRDFVRRSDLVGWYGPDRLLVVSPESEPRNPELEARLRQVLRDSRLVREGGPGLEVRMGTSSYPDDGDDAGALLQTAVGRLR